MDLIEVGPTDKRVDAGSLTPLADHSYERTILLLRRKRKAPFKPLNKKKTTTMNEILIFALLWSLGIVGVVYLWDAAIRRNSDDDLPKP